MGQDEIRGLCEMLASLDLDGPKVLIKVYREHNGLQSESGTTKGRQTTIDNRLVVFNTKEKVEGSKKGASFGKERDMGIGVTRRGREVFDAGSAEWGSQLSSEASGSGLEINKSYTVTDVKKMIVGDTNQTVGGLLTRTTQAPHTMATTTGEVLSTVFEEIQIEGLEENKGYLDGNHNNVENEGIESVCVDNIALSPGKASVRKWRRAARKMHAFKGLIGVISPIKRILEAYHIAKTKNRDNNLSPKGKGHLRGRSKKNSSKRKEVSGVKRKIILPSLEEEADEKKLKMSPSDLVSKDIATPKVQARRAL
ncbi:hypothetical protein LWI28_029240 [Acer negundo]|uniref:Uncharacterized protein n=1 Tax=Acer negundo TaxID=4023 RepID=A0AAD5P2D5_ACENE|nr:hypothetical protein LWI28_029240 [Acer negundo]